MATDGDESSSSIDAIMKVVKMRKAQLQRQQQSVSQANEEAERTNLLSRTKLKRE
ncbi:MAG TPA: hypothetical protein VGQ03_09535 [Nitrososphaera sp.]|nr:hypothetical protein [Nitrososphaera sp.]